MRTTIFTKELAGQIADAIIVGASLRKICAREDMPCISTVMRWLAQGRQEDEGPYAEFVALYDEACMLRAEYWMDMLMDVAEDKIPDEVIDRGHLAVKAWLQQQRLKSDDIKWTVCKMLPKRYGDKMQLTGADDGPILTEVRRVIVDEKNPQSTDTDSAGL